MKRLHIVKLTLSAIASVSLFTSAQTTSSQKSLAEIEAALNPLESLANIDGVRFSIDLNIQFALGSASLLTSANQQINVLGQALQGEKLSGCVIELIGHTDATGSEQANQVLSEARANSVRQALFNGFQIEEHTIEAIGKGEAMLLAGFADDDKRHRRVEITLKDPQGCVARKKQNNKKQKTEEQLKIEW